MMQRVNEIAPVDVEQFRGVVHVILLKLNRLGRCRAGLALNRSSRAWPGHERGERKATAGPSWTLN
jgi:hypothetical protein